MLCQERVEAFDGRVDDCREPERLVMAFVVEEPTQCGEPVTVLDDVLWHLHRRPPVPRHTDRLGERLDGRVVQEVYLPESPWVGLAGVFDIEAGERP